MKGMQGKCFHRETFSWSRGYRHRLPQRAPPSTFLSKVRGNGVLSYKKMFEEGLASVMVAHLNATEFRVQTKLSLFYFL
jgi:hypothetical protein